MGTASVVQSIEDAEEDAEEMIQGVCDGEIKKAMFDIADVKAPGPDGFTACFFKKAWAIVGNEVCAAIRDFFLDGKLLQEINSTIISLIFWKY